MQHDLFSSLDSLLSPSACGSSLLVRDVAGQYRSADADEVLFVARQLLAAQVRGGDVLSTPSVVKDILRARLAHLPLEIFAVVRLDLCVAPINVKAAEQPQVLRECSADLLHMTRSSKTPQPFDDIQVLQRDLARPSSAQRSRNDLGKDLALEVDVGAGTQHRGGQGGMPQPLADRREVSSGAQQVNRRGVPKGVRMQTLFQLGVDQRRTGFKNPNRCPAVCSCWEFITANVLLIQRHAHLVSAVKLEFVNGREGKVARALLTAISNSRRGSGEERSEEATAIQWALWAKQVEHAAEYLGKGSHVNIVGRVRNNYQDSAGVEVCGLAFTVDEIDYLPSKAEGEARRHRGNTSQQTATA